MNKPSKNIRKALAVASIIGASLKSKKTLTMYHKTLQVRCNQAMRVYSAKNYKDYVEVTSATSSIWSSMVDSKEYIGLNEEQYGYYITMIATLLRENDFKKFFNLKDRQLPKLVIHRDTAIRISDALVDLDSKLNAYFGTKPSTEQFKVVKVKKSKPKENKPSKAQLRHEKDVAEKKAKKEDIFKAIRERAKLARERLNNG